MTKKTPADEWLSAMQTCWPNLTMTDAEKESFNKRYALKEARKADQWEPRNRLDYLDPSKDGGPEYRLDKLGYGA